jgi:hypothetical protein
MSPTFKGLMYGLEVLIIALRDILIDVYIYIYILFHCDPLILVKIFLLPLHLLLLLALLLLPVGAAVPLDEASELGSGMGPWTRAPVPWTLALALEPTYI